MKKLTNSDIDIFLLTREMTENQIFYVKELLKRKNKPITLQISNVYFVMDKYAPAIVGQSIKNKVFVCRRMERKCLLFLQPNFWNGIRKVRKKYHCIVPFE